MSQTFWGSALYNTMVIPEVSEPVQYGPSAAETLNPDQHRKLVRHLYRCMSRGEKERRRRISHMEATETDLLGIVKPDGADCQRVEKRQNGEGVSVPDYVYPFGWIRLQNFASEIASIVMPQEAPYAVATSATFQEKANALVKAFRHQGVLFDHRNNVHAAIFDMIALDCGALRFEWSKKKATSASYSPEGLLRPDDVHGTEIRALDPYNISWDPDTQIAHIATQSEFFIEYTTTTPHKLARDRQDGKNFIPTSWLELIWEAEAEGTLHAPGNPFFQHANNTFTQNWFYHEPQIAKSRKEILDHWGSNRENVEYNHSGLFNASDSLYCVTEERLQVSKIIIRLQPSRFGLAPTLRSKRDKSNEPFSIWEFHLLAPGYIIKARQLDDTLDQFPVSVGNMSYGRRFGRSFQFGPHAAQYGLLASTYMNLMKRAMRKGVEGGLTLYDSDMVNLADLPDLTGGRIGVRMNRERKDIRSGIVQLSDIPDYKNTLNDVNGVNQFLTTMFPQNAQPAMAGLDRATSYQAQAVMVTGDRSFLWHATLVDGQLLVPARLHLQHFTLQHPQPMQYVDDTTQQLMELTKEDLQEARFSLVQSQPLMGVDRLRAENFLQHLFNSILQAGRQLSPIERQILQTMVQIGSIPVSLDDIEKTLQEEAARQQEADRQDQMEAEARAAATPRQPTVRRR